MLSVKLVRSLVLGETIHSHTHDDSIHPNLDYDDHEDQNIIPNNNKKKTKKMPMLLFIPTKELISDTFRLATIARDIGMDFLPSPSLSHLLFSWPTTPSTSSPSNPNNVPNHRTSVSSSTSTFTTISSSATATTISSASSSSNTFRNDCVPIPFPSLTTTTSLSLLRFFVSLSKGLFKLVFLDVDPQHCNNYYLNHDFYTNKFVLFCRVTGKRVRSMDDVSRELAGHGWALYRTPEKRKSNERQGLVVGDEVYLFRKVDANRVRVKGYGNGSGEGGESRMRELRLPAVEWDKGVNLRVLLYILLMTDDIFYIS